MDNESRFDQWQRRLDNDEKQLVSFFDTKVTASDTVFIFPDIPPEVWKLTLNIPVSKDTCVLAVILMFLDDFDGTNALILTTNALCLRQKARTVTYPYQTSAGTQVPDDIIGKIKTKYPAIAEFLATVTAPEYVTNFHKTLPHQSSTSSPLMQDTPDTNNLPSALENSPATKLDPTLSFRLDLNNATLDDLLEMPGFSLVTAQSFIKERDRRHGFASYTDIGEFLDLQPHQIEKLRMETTLNPMSDNTISKASKRAIVDY